MADDLFIMPLMVEAYHEKQIFAVEDEGRLLKSRSNKGMFVS